jgi:hypothetical protein
MRTLIGLLLFTSALLLSSCAVPCQMGAGCWISGVNGLTVQMRGTVEFTDDDRDVRSLSPGGMVMLPVALWLGLAVTVLAVLGALVARQRHR